MRASARIHADGPRAQGGAARQRPRPRAGGRRRASASAPIAGQVLDRAKTAGVLREDFEDFDVPMMHFAVGYVADRTRDVAPEYCERMLTILLDGLAPRRDGVTPMPAPPLTPEQFASGLARRC